MTAPKYAFPFRTLANARWVLLILVCFAQRIHAQRAASNRLPDKLRLDSDAEYYLRVLQTLGEPNGEPWSLRPFTRTQLRRMPTDSGHPWKAMPDFAGTDNTSVFQLAIAPLKAHVWYNSAFPFGMNDGPVWVGRGMTASMSAGGKISLGPISISLRPSAFWAQNQRFALLDNKLTGLLRFGDMRGGQVDKPQRFGDGHYARFNLGESAVRVEGLGLTTGVSTESLWWGPMSRFPYLLGNNAGGFPHAFAGTSRSINVLIGRVGGRVIYADLAQSKYSPASLGRGRRFLSGMVLVFQPRFLRGLEVGGGRVFHAPWPDSGLTSDYFATIFTTFIKADLKTIIVRDPDNPNQSGDNQLASAFFRWSFGAGIEVYGEFGREDHNWDIRDLIVEPDHSASISIGARKTWRHSEQELVSLSYESIDFDPGGLGRHRGEGGAFIHYVTSQGHTYLGQPLSTAFSMGIGTGQSVRLDRFRPDGLASLTLSRLSILEGNETLNVQLVAELRRTKVRGNRELSVGVAGVYELNRNLLNDAMNWRVDVGARQYLGRRD